MIANIRPGILVALRTRVAGGVEYQREDLDAATEDAPAGATVEKWNTTRIVEDLGEYDRAKACRGAAQAVIGRVCVRTDFGLLCVGSREAELDAAVAAAQELARAHNATAEHTRVEIYALKGRVAETDDEAAKGIASEVRALLEGMDAGITKGDPKAIREAASRARKLAQLLDNETAVKVSDAVAEAREAARVIVKRVIEGGEAVEAVVKEISSEARDAARFVFLDMEPVAEISEPAAVATDLDLEMTASFPVDGDLAASVDRAAKTLAAAEVKRRKNAKRAAARQLDIEDAVTPDAEKDVA